jgi:hypothetical protein
MMRNIMILDTECCYAWCHLWWAPRFFYCNTECQDAERHYAMLIVIMLSVIMLSVNMLSVNLWWVSLWWVSMWWVSLWWVSLWWVSLWWVSICWVSICDECHCDECQYSKCNYVECHYYECQYVECHYDGCHFAKCRGATKFSKCTGQSEGNLTKVMCRKGMNATRAIVHLGKVHSGKRRGAKSVRVQKAEGHFISLKLDNHIN